MSLKSKRKILPLYKQLFGKISNNKHTQYLFSINKKGSMDLKNKTTKLINFEEGYLRKKLLR